MKTKILSAILCSAVSAAFSAETNRIPVVTVTASSQTVDSADIHDVLNSEPGVVLSSQGGSQNDLSVRGSSFSGAGLSLGGMTLNNPQTEHFNAELPLPAAMLSRPGVQTGLDNQGGHLVGTVGFNLLPITGTKQLEAGFGSDHRDWQSLLVQQMLTDTLGIGVFAGRESASGVDYPDNDFDRKYLGGHLQYQKSDTQIDLLLSHQEKEFGARGYYGVTDALEAEEATKDTLIFLSALRGSLNSDYLRGGLSWHEFSDDYQLPTIGYRNQHRSDVLSAFTDGRTLEINGWSLGWRADVEEENMTSSSMGNHDRTSGGLSLLPQWRGDRLTVTIGARGEFFTDESSEFLPQLGAEYMLTDNLTAFASYTESVRQPSYTELYYFSPASIGDSTLEAQTAAQTEIGMKGIPSEFMDWKVSLFHRRTKNTVDWIQETSTSSWTATDIGTLNTYGLEATMGWYPVQNFEAQLAYTWLHKNKTASDYDSYASRYALDYPEHLAQASLLWRPTEDIEVGTVQAVRLQTDNNARDGSDWGVDSSLVVRYTPPKMSYATLSMLINNAWDDGFETFPGQLPAGRYAGLSLTLNF
jgi:iron complex outermembrane receptor protein